MEEREREGARGEVIERENRAREIEGEKRKEEREREILGSERKKGRDRERVILEERERNRERQR